MFEIVLLLSFWFQDGTVSVWEQLLSAPSYPQRQQASRLLWRYGDLSLYQQLARSSDPEVRWRGRYCYERRRELVLRSLQPYPRLDMLWTECKQNGTWQTHHTAPLAYYLHAYLPDWNRVRDQGPIPPEVEDACLQQSCRLWSRACLDAGLPPWLLRLLIWEMRRRETIVRNNPVQQTIP